MVPSFSHVPTTGVTPELPARDMQFHLYAIVPFCLVLLFGQHSHSCHGGRFAWVCQQLCGRVADTPHLPTLPTFPFPHRVRTHYRTCPPTSLPPPTPHNRVAGRALAPCPTPRPTAHLLPPPHHLACRGKRTRGQHHRGSRDGQTRGGARLVLVLWVVGWVRDDRTTTFTHSTTCLGGVFNSKHLPPRPPPGQMGWTTLGRAMANLH